MKRKITVIFTATILLLTLIAACAAPASVTMTMATPTITPTVSPAPTLEVTPTLTPEPIPAATPTPALVKVPSIGADWTTNAKDWEAYYLSVIKDHAANMAAYADQYFPVDSDSIYELLFERYFTGISAYIADIDLDSTPELIINYLEATMWDDFAFGTLIYKPDSSGIPQLENFFGHSIPYEDVSPFSSLTGHSNELDNLCLYEKNGEKGIAIFYISGSDVGGYGKTLIDISTLTINEFSTMFSASVSGFSDDGTIKSKLNKYLSRNKITLTQLPLLYAATEYENADESEKISDQITFYALGFDPLAL